MASKKLTHSAEEIDNILDSVGGKANATDLEEHISNQNNPHHLTKEQLGLNNVENKSSATIRGELTAANVNTALGMDPIAAISALEDRCGKNELDLSKLKSINTAGTWDENVYTYRGITFTVNYDNTITVNGTAASTATLTLNKGSNLSLTNGDYILSGCPEGGSANSYRLDATRTVGSSLNDIGNGVLIQVGKDYDLNDIRCVVLTGTVCDNLLFQPMIRRAELPAGYQPYAPTNRQLYEMILAVSGNQVQSVQSTAQLMASSDSEEETR